MIQAELISIGDELLIGQTINTNAAWIGQQLALNGIQVGYGATISDQPDVKKQAFDSAFERSDLILVTGGLGPTKDDITKHVLADYFNTKLVVNESVLDHIQAFFEKRNRPMLEANNKQAELPENCTVLFNRMGTAAGMWFEKNGKVLISMPGVPYEMKTIFSEEALPKIVAQFPTVQLIHRTVLVQGIGESFLADQLKDWENRLRESGLSLAYLPSPGVVKLRITSLRGESDQQLIDGFVKELYSALPKNLFGEGENSLSQVVGELLREKKQTIGTVESCTSGAVAASLTSISGSSDYFQGSVIPYSNELKMRIIGVEPKIIEEFGAVSQQTIEALAISGKRILGVDWCVSTSGIAGPTGGNDLKPIGTIWVAIAGPNRVWSKLFRFGDNRERNIQMTVLSALNGLRCELLKLND